MCGLFINHIRPIITVTARMTKKTDKFLRFF